MEETLDSETDATVPPDADATVAAAAEHLGEPQAIFKASPRRVRIKFLLAFALILYGIAGNIGWFVFGPATFGHWQIHLLVVPPIIGSGLLWHLWKHRGLRVLIYPTGLLRIQGGEVQSFPWDEIRGIRMKLHPTGDPHLLYSGTGEDDRGPLKAAWIETTAPTFQVWNVWLEIIRLDDVAERFTAVLADFPEFVTEVQRRSFPSLWAATQSILESGESVEFADKLTANDAGLTYGKTTILWHEMKYLNLSGKLISVKRKGAWMTGIARDATTITNLHVLFALGAEKGVIEELDEGDDD
jgi:hypothetical protein